MGTYDFKRQERIDLSEASSAFVYCPMTGELRWSHHQNNVTRLMGKLAGSRDPRGYIKLSFRGAPIWAHRLAWALYYNQWPDGVIDHIDGDRSNNAIKNLRVVTQKENTQNARLRSNKTSAYRGVSCCRGQWAAVIYIDKKQQWLGVFETEHEAASAYNAAALEAYGKHAKINEVTA